MDISLSNRWSSPNVTISTRETRDPEKLSRTTWLSYVVWLVTSHCKFGANLNELLRDRLVCGVNNPAVIRKLLAEANLISEKPWTSHKQRKQQFGMPTRCTRRKLQYLPINFVLNHRVQSSKVDLRLNAASHAIAAEARTRRAVLTRMPLVTTATRLDTSMWPAARNVLASAALRHNEHPRRRRHLGTRQDQHERTTSRRMTQKMSSTFVTMTRTLDTRGHYQFGLNRPSTGDLSKVSSTQDQGCPSFLSVSTLRTLQTSSFHKAVSYSKRSLANECCRQVLRK